MNDWLRTLRGVEFMPHGHCYFWRADLVWLHGIADSLIAFAYFSIPLVILHFVRRRPDLPFPRIFLMFAAFIVACGTTHVMEVVTIWQPIYWASGAIKLLTAGISLASAFALVRIVPAALDLPSPAGLRLLNEALEERVQARTGALTAANDRLRSEAGQREQAEAEVHRLNAELERRLAELETLFNLMPVGVGIALDPGCRELRFNAAYAEMHGLPRASRDSFRLPPTPLPAACRMYHGNRELTAEEMPMPRAMASNAPVRDFEKTIVRADGTTREVLANAVPIQDAAGRPRGCVATFQDITARQRIEHQQRDLERKLQQSQKLESIGILAGGIAHDFNNLLTGVLGHASFARQKLAGGGTDIDPLLAQVELSAQRAADLCRQLLAYAGKGRFIIKPIDLNLTVREAQPLLLLSISPKLTLELQLADGLPPFRGDPTQISQVLMNFVLNASEAMGDQPGVITLRTYRTTLTPMDLLTMVEGTNPEPGSHVALQVTDRGCGVTPEAMPHLFEPFFTTKFVGRGLGLAAVLGIMHGHRGGIRVESKVGEGSTFELFFPVATAAETFPTHPVASHPANRGTILVVDDEDAIRTFAHAALRDAGFDVVTAPEGETALVHLRSAATQFDAVVLDLTMPKFDGEETLMALRMIAPRLPVILTSGHQERASMQRFISRGLADFLPKPFGAQDLVRRIESAIAREQAGAVRG